MNAIVFSVYSSRQHSKCFWLFTRAATVQIFFGSVWFKFLILVFGYFGSVQATVYCSYFTSKTCTHNVNVYFFSTTNIKQLQNGDQKIEMLQEGAIFSRSLNDYRRMIATGLPFIKFSSQNVCFNNVYS